MSQKKTYKPKPAPEGYKFNAQDGDNDGLVQDSTEFERPVGTELYAEELSKLPDTHVMQEGENILTVAEKYLPEGKTRNEYAKELLALNGRISVGSVIRLV